jgi:hypothetical protein
MSVSGTRQQCLHSTPALSLILPGLSALSTMTNALKGACASNSPSSPCWASRLSATRPAWPYQIRRGAMIFGHVSKATPIREPNLMLVDASVTSNLGGNTYGLYVRELPD